MYSYNTRITGKVQAVQKGNFRFTHVYNKHADKWNNTMAELVNIIYRAVAYLTDERIVLYFEPRFYPFIRVVLLYP